MKTVIGFFILVQQFSAQTWMQLDDFPGTRRDDGAAVVVNSTAYFGTGLQEGWSSTTDWYALDMSNLKWRTVKAMPDNTERQYANAFAGPDAFYVFGGIGPGAALNNLYRYDINSDTWAEKTPKPGKGLIGAACLPFGNKVFIVGGKVHHDSVPTSEVWEYNTDNDLWQRRKDLPFAARWRSAGCSLGPYGYLAGGVGAGDFLFNKMYRYDPGTDTWDSLGVLPQVPVFYPSLQPLLNKLIFFGGQDSSGQFHNSSWYYSVTQQQWYQGPVLPSGGRKGGMAVSFNEKFIYSCGLGVGNQRLNETWMLDLPLSLEELVSQEVSVYPNPFVEFIQVSVETGELLTVTIFDTNGTEILQTSISGHKKRLDTSSLPSGLYLMKLSRSDGRLYHKKVVKY